MFACGVIALTCTLLGDAEVIEQTLRLTPAENNRSGAAWLRDKQSVRAGFETEFQFQLTDQGGLGPGADGFAFVVQSIGDSAKGGWGASGGFGAGDGRGRGEGRGIPKSMAVFFDTHHNPEDKDPSDNYVVICNSGPKGKLRWPPARLGLNDDLPVRLKDGQVHTARIVYDPPVLSVFLDSDAAILKTVVDPALMSGPDGKAWVGFTASTGGGYENHDILSWSFRGTEVSSDLYDVSSRISYALAECIEGKNLCTPVKAIVQQTGPNEFHVVLPAHLEWGAEIPNPTGREVVVKDARGTICLDLKGEEPCTGPQGSALLMRTQKGRTSFSVNDRTFGNNQGFFEFDVQLQ
ncbi:MAG: hypothetical protein H7039_02220 [Bryobacteraceae bacterium]|nr:hypothetical protein [Bryobacteraceae bacterium]